MADKLITPPASEPVTAAELRAWLRGVPDEDDVLEELIKAAREFVEQSTNRALMQQTRRFTMDRWPVHHASMGDWDGVREGAVAAATPKAIDLPIGPLISIDEVRTFADDGTPSIVPASIYFADTARDDVGGIALNGGNSWPVPGRQVNGIEIDYVAGYGESASDVPSPLKLAIKQMAAHYYENREAVGEMSLSEAPKGAASIIKKYRVWPGI